MTNNNTQFNPANFEAKWRKMWEEKQIYKTEENSGKEKYYCLDMYPYPSGSGLHVGHPRGYLGTDVVSRYMRMKGKNVLHPMGFDSFGLPAENYAIKTGTHPQITTDNAVKTFKQQIEAIGLSYDWTREVQSHDPNYYKWTQWLFLQLYKKGLAYKKEAPVNWCNSCQTVLANEQVLSDGTCERCGTQVVQKNMAQWFYKITAFTDRLIDDLQKIDWPESTKLGQINWMGRSQGAEIKFSVFSSQSSEELANLTVFSTAPDTIQGATFMVIAPEHNMIQSLKNNIVNWDDVQNYLEEAKKKTELERQQQKDKTGTKIEGIYAINPITDRQIPIFVADYVLASYGTGAIMAVPGHDERDYDFAKNYNLDIVYLTADQKLISYSEVIKKNPENFKMVNSGEFDGLNFKEGREKIMSKLNEMSVGEEKTQYRLRDWLVSRQRFWGAPIPIVYDPEGKEHPVAEEDLPVMLPTDVDFKPTGESPLRYSESFHKSAEEKYGKGWKREVDTMDTFVDSSWYFLRFTDPHNENAFASKEQMNKFMPIDLYVGGAEHTVLHLLYARFFVKFLYDEGYINFDEPVAKLRHQGLILAKDGRKMSKRWGNTITPDEEIKKYGADTLRIYEMFIGPFDVALPWSDRTESGVFRFLQKVWKAHFKVEKNFENDKQEIEINKLIKKVGRDIELLSFNTAVAKMMEFINFVTSEERINQSVWERFLKVLAPFGPYITEELWNQLGNEFSIHQQSWPEFKEELTLDEIVNIAVQINGKTRGTVAVAFDSEEETVMAEAKKLESINKYFTSAPKKVIYVKNRVLNVVI